MPGAYRPGQPPMFVITTSTKPIEAGTQVKLADNG